MPHITTFKMFTIGKLMLRGDY